MKLQLLSDLHLETEAFDAEPAPGAEVLVLAGDIDSTWTGLQRFARWPVPVLFVPGNHEFDGREFRQVVPELRAVCAAAGIRLLHRETVLLTASDGRRVRFVGTPRWSDFDLFGERGREQAMRAAAYFVKLMHATRDARPLDVQAVREEGLACRRWLEHVLQEPPRGRWELTVAITHFGPSLRSADPRYASQASTASFCGADDDLLAGADLWLHGHLHCRHDYRVPRPGRLPTRVVCRSRGLSKKGEADGFDPRVAIEI